jgi:hypothetical protein
MTAQNEKRKPKKPKIKLKGVIFLEIFVLLLLFGGYYVITNLNKNPKASEENNAAEDNQAEETGGKDTEPVNELTPEEKAAQEEQERLQKEIADRDALINEAKRLTLGYDYDGAIEMIKGYQGKEGGYQVYPVLVQAITDIEAQKASLVLYGGSYDSVTQFNHIFFHSLIADNSKAFDGDEDQKGYNMYMTTVTEFKNMIQKMYEDGYVLVSIHDIAKKVTNEDGTTEFKAQEIYLPQGKKPFVLSQDDVSYYEYMTGDGFATRIVIGEDGKITCEMAQDDGSTITGAFDMVPIIDQFVEEHPDFSYRGAKGILALTGYEGVMGYRTNDPESPTYEQDKIAAKAVADAMKAEGWEFASHTWGHKNMSERSASQIETDAKRWKDEVEPIIGATDILIFPYGVDIETTMGTYSSDKYKLLKEMGFDYYCGVYSQPWMHIKKDYVRMTRRPLDGQAMLEFPERLADLFDLKTIIDPERPAKDW